MRPLDRALVLAVFKADGLQKQISADFGVSQGAVSNIKNGRRHTDITGMAAFNATLITLACTGEA